MSHLAARNPRCIHRVAIVIAELDEFHAGVPHWAEPNVAQAYCVAPPYQRKDPEVPNFVPQRGLEGGVYLKFVVDYYDNLPDVTVFMRPSDGRFDDLQQRLAILEKHADEVKFQPMGVRYKPGSGPKRDAPRRELTDRRLSGARHPTDLRDRCYARIANAFGAPDTPSADLGDQVVAETASYYPGGYFAVSRAMIRRIPLAVWRSTYHDLVVKGECVPEMRLVDSRMDKWVIGAALERMSAVMYGGKSTKGELACGDEYVMQDVGCPGNQAQPQAQPMTLNQAHEGASVTEMTVTGALGKAREPDAEPEQEWGDSTDAAEGPEPAVAMTGESEGQTGEGEYEQLEPHWGMPFYRRIKDDPVTSTATGALGKAREPDTEEQSNEVPEDTHWGMPYSSGVLESARKAAVF